MGGLLEFETWYHVDTGRMPSFFAGISFAPRPTFCRDAYFFVCFAALPTTPRRRSTFLNSMLIWWKFILGWLYILIWMMRVLSIFQKIIVVLSYGLEFYCFFFVVSHFVGGRIARHRPIHYTQDRGDDVIRPEGDTSISSLTPHRMCCKFIFLNYEPAYLRWHGGVYDMALLVQIMLVPVRGYFLRVCVPFQVPKENRSRNVYNACGIADKGRFFCVMFCVFVLF